MMEVWDDEDLVLPTGRLVLHSDASETSGSSTSASALFSDDHRQPDDDFDDLDDDDWSAHKGRDSKSSRLPPVQDDDEEDERSNTLRGVPPSWGLPRPRSGLAAQLPADSHSTAGARTPHSSVSSLASHTENDDDNAFDADFDLPASLDRVTLSPVVERRLPSTPQTRRREGSSASDVSAPAHHHASTSRLDRRRDAAMLVTSSSSSTAVASNWSDCEPDTEAAFFDDLVLPPFLGGPGIATPPDSARKGRPKLDLQALLAAKLQARRDAGDATGLRSGPPHRHVEPCSEPWEAGLVIDDDHDWTASAAIKPRGTARQLSPSTTRTARQALVPSPRLRSNSGSLSRSHSANASLTALAAPPPATPSFLSRPPPRNALRPSISTTALVQAAPSTRRQHGAADHPAAPSSNTLRHKKSTPHMHQPTTLSTAPLTPSLARKRSLASLSEARPLIFAPGSTPLPSARFTTPGSVTPTATPRTYARPTQASRARQSTYPLSTVPALPSPPRARPSTPAAPGTAIRLNLPTLSSRAKTRHVPSASDPSGRSSASLGVAVGGGGDITIQATVTHAVYVGAPPYVVRRPKRRRQYGDGTELDAFDDLPTNKERERRFMARRAPEPASGSTGASATARRPPLPLPSRTRHREAKAKPHLIRNLNPSSVPRVESGMTWNPHALRWEGNDGALRLFDGIVATSARPALITHIAGPSASSPQVRRTTSGAGASRNGGLTVGLGGVRVVGDMVFDPVRMSWHSRAPEGDEELDFGDDEADNDAANADTMRLRPKASFASDAMRSATTSTMSSSVISMVDDAMTHLEDGEQVFWAACVAAERRHVDELRSWAARRIQLDPARKHLWEIRKIVMAP